MIRYLFFAFASLYILQTKAQGVSITANYLGGFHPSDSTTDIIDKTYKDKFGNIYCIGRSTLAFVSKSNPNGQLEWIEYLPPATFATHYPSDIAVDDSGFVYAVGSIGSAAWIRVYDVNGVLMREGNIASMSYPVIAGANHLEFYTLASSGASAVAVRKNTKVGSATWTRTINSVQGALYALRTDSAQNVYAILSSNSRMVMVKYSPTGVTLDSIVWVATTNPVVSVGGVLRDVNFKGNYFYILTDQNSQGIYTHLYKIDTGLNLIWKNEFKWKLNDGGKVCSDDSANHYVVTRADSSAWGYIKRTAILKIEPDSGKRVWERYFYQPDGYHYAPAFVSADSTGLYIVGDKSTYNFSDSSTYLAKYDFQGNLLYSKITNHTNHAQLKGLIANGNRLITVLHANENAGTKQDMIFSVTNTHDTTEIDRVRYDTHQSGNHITRDIAQDNFGNLYTVGNTFNKTYRCTNAYLRKTDASGNLIWARSFRGNSHSVAVDTTNQLVWVVAASDTLGRQPEYLVINKYDYNGNVVCSKIMKMSYNGEHANVLKMDSRLDYNNDLIIHGMGLNGVTYTRRLILMKIGANCDTLWARGLGISSGKLAFNHSVYIDSTNSIDTYSENEWLRYSSTGAIVKSYSYGNRGVLATKSRIQDSVYYLYRSANLLLKYKTGSNSEIWQKTIGNFSLVADNEFLAITTDAKDNVYILVADGPNLTYCGVMGDNHYYRDVYLLKASPQGDSVWVKKIGTTRRNYYNNFSTYYYSYNTSNAEEFKEYQVCTDASAFYLNNAGNLVLCTSLVSDSVCSPGYNNFYNAYPTTSINVMVLDTSGNILARKIIDNPRHLWDTYQSSLFNKATGKLTLVGASQSEHGWLQGVGYDLTITDTNGPCTVNGTFSASICQGSSYHFNGQNLSATGVYKDTLTSSLGCDSVVQLTLTAVTDYAVTVDTAIQQGAVYILPSGTGVSAAGVYVDTLQSSGGCDSVITTNLSVISSVTGTANMHFDITVYPNPATSELYIDAGGRAVSSVLIYNSIGSLISMPQQPTNRIDISTLPGGVYIAQITAGGVTKKVRWVKL